MSKTLFCFAVSMSLMGVWFLPHPALADTCGNALQSAGYSGGCQDTGCVAPQITVNEILGALPKSVATSVMTNCICASGQSSCVTISSDALCEAVGKAYGQPTGCISACVSGANKNANQFTTPPVGGICTNGKVCCVSTNGQPVADGVGPGGKSCIDTGQLKGVTATCKTSAGADELDSTKYSSLAKYTSVGNVTGCPKGQVCVVQRNPGLCAAFSGLLGASGNTCVASEAGCVAGTVLKAKTGDMGEACPGSQVCCQSKTPVTPPKVKYYVLYNALGTTSIPVVIGRIISTFLGIVGAIALLVFVYGGIAWMTARGNDKQAESARSAIVNGVIGLAIIAFAYTISTSVIKMLTTTETPAAKILPSEQTTQAETESAQVQTTIQEQKAKEKQATK